jgi:hypothetical protein
VATHIIVIEEWKLAHRGIFYMVTLNGAAVCSSLTPFCSAARQLLAEGCSPRDRLIMRHKGSDVDCLKASVGEAAKWTVSGSFKQFVPYKVFEGAKEVFSHGNG